MKSIKDDEQITSSCLHFCVDIDIREPLSCHGDFYVFWSKLYQTLDNVPFMTEHEIAFSVPRGPPPQEAHSGVEKTSKIEADISLSEKRDIYTRLYDNSCNAIQTTNVCNF